MRCFEDLKYYVASLTDIPVKFIMIDQSGVGIGGILSVVGAGVALKSIEEMDSSFPHRKRPRVKKSIHTRSTKERLEQRPINPPVPKSMSKILITDADESYLQKCAENLSTASFPPTKAEIGQIDLNASFILT